MASKSLLSALPSGLLGKAAPAQGSYAGLFATFVQSVDAVRTTLLPIEPVVAPALAPLAVPTLPVAAPTLPVAPAASTTGAPDVPVAAVAATVEASASPDSGDAVDAAAAPAATGGDAPADMPLASALLSSDGGTTADATPTVNATAASSASPLTTEAVVPQPTAPGDVVGLVLQNPTGAALPAAYATFGLTFAEGQVAGNGTAPTVGLVASINGAKVPVQIDAKTFYPDGSVKMAVLTLQQPALAANASDSVMLQLAPVSGGAPISLAALAAGSGGWDATVTITGLSMTGNASVTPATSQTFDVDSLLRAAIAGHDVTTWLSGPEATEVEFSVPYANTPMRLTFDLRQYADGSVYCDVQFNADEAMVANLGTESIGLSYTVGITQTGSEVAAGAGTVLAPTAVTEYQYQTWDQQVWSSGAAPQVNVQQDVAALERTGAVQNYDLSIGLDTNDIAIEAARLGTSQFGVLQGGYYTEYMPETGGRPDIGPQPKWDVEWLLTQDSAAAQYALAMSDAGSAVPWHLYDPTTGTYVSSTNFPNLWVSSANIGNAIPLDQPASTGVKGLSGWTIDQAHEPDVAYTAYLMTGNEYYLAQLNAEAAYDIVGVPPSSRTDGGAGGSVAQGQLRGVAWTLREVIEAASANPTGSTEQQYFLGAAEDTISFLTQEAENAGEGAVSGWFENPVGKSGFGTISPWWEDYLATTLGLACGLGIAGATGLLAWETNFLAGRFLNPAGLLDQNGNPVAGAGLDPYSAIAYSMTTYQKSTGSSLFLGIANAAPLTSWSGVASTEPIFSAGNLALDTSTDYQSQALAALAESITYTGSTQAIEAYGWLQAYATAANATLFRQDPSFDIVPRLSDGQLLTYSQVFIRNDTGSTPVVVRGSGSDQLIYEEGNAPATILGGAGINILFGGGGTTRLVGGPTSDYLYGGTGATTFQSGSGNDFIQVQASTVNNTITWTAAPAATIILSESDTGHDTVAGFRVGTDHLLVSGPTPISTLISTATPTQGGSIVLHLSASHDITLQGVATASERLFLT